MKQKHIQDMECPIYRQQYAARLRRIQQAIEFENKLRRDAKIIDAKIGENLEEITETRAVMSKVITEAQFMLKQYEEAEERIRQTCKNAIAEIEHAEKLDYEHRLAESKRLGFMRDASEEVAYRLLLYRHEEEKKKKERLRLKEEEKKARSKVKTGQTAHFSFGGSALPVYDYARDMQRLE